MEERLRHDRPRTAFLTFSCRQRQHWMATTDVRTVICDQLAADTSERLIELHAWIIMANHMHVLATDDRLRVSNWIRRFKQATAFQLRNGNSSQLAEPAHDGAFWMRGGGYDRTIWSWQEYWNKVRYIHFNPVRAGLCRRAEDWEWSSAQDFCQVPRCGFPSLARPPHGLVDLLWWRPLG